MKNQPSKIILRSLVLTALAFCVTATTLESNAQVRGDIRRGGGFDDGRGSGRDDRDMGRGGRDDRGRDDRGRDDRDDRGRDDRSSRRGDLRDRREVERLVDLLYRAALNRRADYEGIAGFSREILNRGSQGLFDSARLIGSVPEFNDIVRREGSRRVVYNIYRVFFNRTPDPSGLYNWSRLLEEGRGGDVMAGIVASEEFYQTQL